MTAPVAREPPLRGRELGSPGTTFALAEYTDGPPDPGAPAIRPIAPLHRHRQEEEAWYVLDGELSVRLDDRTVVAGPGAAVWSGPGVAHTFWNSSPGATRYLLVMGPKTLEFLRALHGAEGDPADVAALAIRCGIEFLEGAGQSQNARFFA